MATITYWTRMEPNASAPLERTVRAELRDPLWLLARQWQIGELRAENSGSPSKVAVKYVIDTYGSELIEPTHLGARPAADLQTRVAAAEVWIAALDSAHRDALLARLRELAPLPRPDDDDPRGLRAYRNLRKHYFDGVTALDLPNPGVVGPEADAFETARAEAAEWVRQVRGHDVRHAELAPAWEPERLQHEIHVAAVSGDVAVTGSIGPSGEVDWYTFDSAPPIAPSQRRIHERELQPTYVSFRGAPSHRFWEIEDGGVNLDAVVTGPQELPKAVVLDFLMVHSNDWYLIPFEQQIGTSVHVLEIIVTDVFGDTLQGIKAAALDRDWAMFTPSSTPGQAARPQLFLPAAAGLRRATGPVQEEVSFVRDEAANLVWAVESQLRDATGAGRNAPPSVSLPTAPSDTWQYELMTQTRAQWHPFEPVQPDPNDPGAPKLERVVFQTLEGDYELPRALVLATVTLPQIVHDREVPRQGTRLTLRSHLCRGSKGETYAWHQVERDFARGEVRGGLEFDRLIGPAKR